MSDLAKRLRASIMYDAINGTAEERAVVARQILEASDYIENFEIGLDAMKEGIGIRIADLESENERLREELGNMNDANAECYHQQAEIERLTAIVEDRNEAIVLFQDVVETQRDIIAKLPKTADGVPVMPGDDVWVGPSSPHCCFVNGIMPGDVVRLDFHGHSYATVVGKKDTYSTREAAEAAGGE